MPQFHLTEAYSLEHNDCAQQGELDKNHGCRCLHRHDIILLDDLNIYDKIMWYLIEKMDGGVIDAIKI